MDIDEDALLTNLALGTDLPTSIAGAIKDTPSPPATRGQWVTLGVVIGGVITIIVWLLVR